MLLDAAGRERMLAHYAPRILPDHHGGHLAWAYQFCRDMMLFYPYFDRDPDHRTANGVPDPDQLHPMVVDVLKALTTYHCAYNAAFAYDAVAALPQVRHPTLLSCAQRDPLSVDLVRAATLLPRTETQLYPIGTSPAEVAARVTRFLRAPDNMAT
jgi:pimeloyl-ACP methyl ester carboxylesterase